MCATEHLAPPKYHPTANANARRKERSAEPMVTPLYRKLQNPKSRMIHPKPRNQSPKAKRRTEKGRCVCDLARVGTDNDVVATSVELLAASNAELAIHAYSAVLLDVRGVASDIRRADGELVDLQKITR